MPTQTAPNSRSRPGAHGQPSNESQGSPRVMDMLEAMAMDPTTAAVYQSGQFLQYRRKAIQYTAVRSPPREDAPSLFPQPFAPMRQNQQQQQLQQHQHQQQQQQQIFSGDNNGMDTASLIINSPQLIVEEAHSGADNTETANTLDCICGMETAGDHSGNQHEVAQHVQAGDIDDELYLRRVSILYHELWNGEWADRRISRDDAAVAVGSKNTANNQAQTTPIPGHSCMNPPGVNAAATGNGAAKSDTPGSESAIDSESATPRVSLDEMSTAGALGHGSDRQKLIARFTPPDLADALTGTVHRLEDDHSLLQHKRWSVVKELAMTEAQYLRDLQLLRTTFMEPLQSAQTSLMTNEDVRLVFGNLDQVIDCARSLVEYLTVAVVYEANRDHILSGSKDGERKDDSFELDHQQWKYASGRPVSQPEAPCSVSKPSGAGLRSSAWADISLARAFLLTAHRMERVYTKYCQNFDAASQRLIDLKRLASGGQTPHTTPATPATLHMPSAGSSPFIDQARGWRQSHNNNSGSNTNHEVDPDIAYAVGAHQFISDQAQLLVGKTTSWDLASMLIKPVQRVLKYPLLLRTLVSLTPTGTSDRAQLEKAAQGIEFIAEAINAASGSNGGSGNVRVSTATTASASSTNHDDGHGRIARELRRVLRRKPGATIHGHLRSKSNVDGVPAKDSKPTSLSRSRKKVKDVIDQAMFVSARDRAPQLPVLSSTSPLAALSTQIQQHEAQLVELIHSLRQWEKELGSALHRQCTTIMRWHDLYMLNGPDAGSMDTDGESDTEGLLDREYHTAWGTLDYDDSECRPRAALESPRGEPMLRSSKSYGSLRRPGQIPVSRLPHAASNWTPRPNVLASHHSIIDLKTASSDISETPWQAQRKVLVSKWCSAMETISKSLFPDLISRPLHDSVYPVLNSLLQVYRDGPHRMLSDIVRMSNGSSTAHSSHSSLAEVASESSEATRLESQLVAELPQMFGHEAEIVHLLTVRVVALEREFLSQVLAEMTCACVQPANTLRMQSPLGRQQQYWIDAQWIPRFTAMTLVPPVPTMSNVTSPRNTGTHLGAESGSWAKQIADEYERRAAVGSVMTNGPLSPPAANECLDDIQTALGTLNGLVCGNGESLRNSSGNTPLEPDVWASVIASRFDTADSNLLLATVPTTASDTLTTPDQQSRTESPGTTSGAASPKNSKFRHLRKKSGGFKDKLSYFKTSMPLPEHLLSSSKRGSGRRTGGEPMEHIKARLPLGLAIDVPADDTGEQPASSVPSYFKYDPLPHISSIRFSRGFIDSAFMKTNESDDSAVTARSGITAADHSGPNYEIADDAALVERPLASPRANDYSQPPSNVNGDSPFSKPFY